MPSSIVFDDELVALLPRLRRFAYALSRTPADADDLTQATVERALRSRGQWQPGTRLDSWLYRIMRNLWIDTVRARGRKDKVEAPAAEADRLGEDPREAMDASVDLARMMAAGHPHCYVSTASVGYPIDLMNKVRLGLNHKGAAFLMVYTPCQKGFVYETPRSIDLGRLVVECGLYPIWEWNNEKREYDYSFRPQHMRPVAEYLKLQGRFGHLHAEHIATLQKFANQQWQMMGVALPEALIRAADAKNLVNMASVEAAAAIAKTV